MDGDLQVIEIFSNVVRACVRDPTHPVFGSFQPANIREGPSSRQGAIELGALGFNRKDILGRETTARLGNPVKVGMFVVRERIPLEIRTKVTRSHGTVTGIFRHVVEPLVTQEAVQKRCLVVRSRHEGDHVDSCVDTCRSKRRVECSFLRACAREGVKDRAENEGKIPPTIYDERRRCFVGFTCCVVAFEAKDVVRVGDILKGLERLGHDALHFFAGNGIDRENDETIFRRNRVGDWFSIRTFGQVKRRGGHLEHQFTVVLAVVQGE